jgi:hypothetical protein
MSKRNSLKEGKSTKYEKLRAVIQAMNAKFALIPDEKIQSLCKSWQGANESYEKMLADPDSRVTKSMIANGIEQGLRETPVIIQGIDPARRKHAVEAFQFAISTEYPEFFEEERKRLTKILARGNIRGEAEYYLVRHQIDVLESDAGNEKQLSLLHELVSKFKPSRIERSTK